MRVVSEPDWLPRLIFMFDYDYRFAEHKHEQELLKFQAPKYKSQTNTNDQNSKFKTDRMTARYRIRYGNAFVIRIWSFDIV